MRLQERRSAHTLCRVATWAISLAISLAALPNQFNDDPAPDLSDVLGGFLSEVESLGMLDPADLSSIKAILAKYVGSGSTPATGVTTTPTGDAARDFGRTQGAKVRGEMEHNAKAANAYRTFWDAKNAEFMASIHQ